MQPQKSPSLITKEPFFPISLSRVLKPEKETSLDSASVFLCPEPGCIKTFARFADFELHLDIGEHVVQNEPAVLQHINMSDMLKRKLLGCSVCDSANPKNVNHSITKHVVTAKNLIPKQTWVGLWRRLEVVLLSFLKR